MSTVHCGFGSVAYRPDLPQKPKILRVATPSTRQMEDQATATSLYGAAGNAFSRIANVVSVVGSILNAHESGADVAIDKADLIEFVSDSRDFALTPAKSLLCGCGEELGAAVVAAETRLSAAIEDLLACDGGPACRAALPPAKTWRELAECFLRLELGFQNATGDRVRRDTSPDEKARLDMLREIAASRWPCIDDSGSVTSPEFGERRNDKRPAMTPKRVEVCAEGKWESAEIVDYCYGGFGLFGGPAGLKAGTPIFIEFAGNIGVMCIVRWTLGRHFGVSTNRALQRTLLAKLGIGDAETALPRRFGR